VDAAAYRTRERFVLFAGVAAVALLMLLAVAALAGAPLGRTADKLSGSLVVLYPLRPPVDARADARRDGPT
jgi:hypothetical protein